MSIQSAHNGGDAGRMHSVDHHKVGGDSHKSGMDVKQSDAHSISKEMSKMSSHEARSAIEEGKKTGGNDDVASKILGAGDSKGGLDKADRGDFFKSLTGK